MIGGGGWYTFAGPVDTSQRVQSVRGGDRACEVERVQNAESGY